jgi:hypothetical protein
MKKKTKNKALDTTSLIKMLNNKKTTIHDVLTILQETIEEFQNTKEDFYVNDLKKQLDETDTNATEEDLQRWAEKIQKLVIKDTKSFVQNYIEKMNDNVLDAINEKKVKRDPAHAFLILLQTMESAFQKTNKED